MNLQKKISFKLRAGYQQDIDAAGNGPVSATRAILVEGWESFASGASADWGIGSCAIDSSDRLHHVQEQNGRIIYERMDGAASLDSADLGAGSKPVIAITRSTNEIFVAWVNGAYVYASRKNYFGWQSLGSSALSCGTTVARTAVCTDNDGAVYVAADVWDDMYAATYATVAKWANGASSWTTLGSMSSGTLRGRPMSVIGDVLHIAGADGYNMTLQVFKYNGSGFAQVGQDVATYTNSSDYVCLCGSSADNAYVTFRESNLVVNKFNGSSWSVLPAHADPYGSPAISMSPNSSAIVSSTVPVMPNNNKVVGLISGAWEELPTLVNPNATADIGGMEVLIGKSCVYVLGAGTSYYRFIKR